MYLAEQTAGASSDCTGTHQAFCNLDLVVGYEEALVPASADVYASSCLYQHVFTDITAHYDVAVKVHIARVKADALV